MKEKARICLESISGKQYIEIKQFGSGGRVANQVRLRPDEAAHISLQVLSVMLGTEAGKAAVRASPFYGDVKMVL